MKNMPASWLKGINLKKQLQSFRLPGKERNEARGVRSEESGRGSPRTGTESKGKEGRQVRGTRKERRVVGYRQEQGVRTNKGKRYWRLAFSGYNVK